MPTSNILGAAEIDHFITRGFVRLDDAFPTTLADACRAILWKATGCDPADRATWTRPVIRIGQIGLPAFVAAANTERLHCAYDALVGPGRWERLGALGTFPIRFPSPEDPGDTGWHVDMSFGYDAPDFMEWRANVYSRGRALLMLFLFSDVGNDDAPTRIRTGSHRSIARILAPAGEAGLTLRELAASGFGYHEEQEEVLATGARGTVYLCHPFLVHAAQKHRGAAPKFMAQPPLLPAGALSLARPDGHYSALEQAIRMGITGELMP